MKRLIGISLLAATALCLAATESRVTRASLQAVETSVNEAFNPRGPEPYDLLGEARATYLDGYGTLITAEVDLVVAGGMAFTLTPFKPTATPEELAAFRDRKMKRLPEFKDAMRGLMTNASSTLEGMPANEKIVMEATLFSFSWEKNAKEMPRRILMSAAKQKLLEAKASHASPAELAAIVEEQDR